MSEFFEPPPPPPAEAAERPRTPPWAGPPQGILPGVVALELVLARNDKVAVCVTRLAGYPTGFEFELLTMAAPRQDELELDPMLFYRHRRVTRPGSQELDPDLLRVGVQFSDGAKATNTGGFHHGQEPPPGPVMHSGGGWGGGGRWRQEMWVWPLPPPGPLQFVSEWPAAQIPVTRQEIDAHLILEAAQRAQIIFPEDDTPSPAGSWTGYAPVAQVISHKPRPPE